MISNKQASEQLNYLQQSGFQTKLAQAATAHGLAATYVYAIASRETNCRNILGDWQDGQAHGVGIMQIDVQHEIARQARDSGSWQAAPEPLIDFGCALLAQNLIAAGNDLPTLDRTARLKVAASGYNCGIGRAIGAVRAGLDSDIHTTGGDYGADVIARMAMFADLVTAAVTA